MIQDRGAPLNGHPWISVPCCFEQSLSIVFLLTFFLYFKQDPSDAVDPKLKALRDARGYSYADIITIHPDHLPGFDEKIKAFFEEHIHDAEEIRFILGGSGYFDVRNCEFAPTL